MSKKDKEQRKSELSACICNLPKKMLDVHGSENVTEYLLHHLAAPECFNMTKAAYFVDNPDFDKLKGVVGYSKHEAYQEANHWDQKDPFTKHMQQADFNKTVRSLEQTSPHKNQQQFGQLVGQISKELGLSKPDHHVWKMKHENHGLLIFELSDEQDREIIDEYLQASLYLFGFCPIF